MKASRSTSSLSGIRLVAPTAADGRRALVFSNPQAVLQTASPSEVRDVLLEVEQAVGGGLHAAGFVGYEAAPGFDPHLATYRRSALPLVWFGLFRRAEKRRMSDLITRHGFSVGPWRPSIRAQRYRAAIARIREYLRDGDTYQVNFTFRLRASFTGDPFMLFADLCRAQQGGYPVFVETDDFAVCSASPELFFALDGQDLLSRPMKGTFARGHGYDDDRAARERLRMSEKDRAENVMIVDMVRNDMGRVAEAGSVRVVSLFDVESYPTLFQMTSTVAARTRASLPDIMAALFPCASITGAPKVRTMQIIRELESGPRGVYTGCVGWLSPGRRACFNVAIRTVVVDKRQARAEFGVGGGIVWDSTAANEYDECLVKAAVLTDSPPEFDLLESILWQPGRGFYLLAGHLRRMRESAAYFGYAFDGEALRRQLRDKAGAFGKRRLKVRVRLNRRGLVTIEAAELAEASRAVHGASLGSADLGT